MKIRNVRNVWEMIKEESICGSRAVGVDAGSGIHVLKWLYLVGLTYSSLWLLLLSIC